MANPQSGKGWDRWLHLVKPRLEPFVQKHGADVTMAMPALRLAIFQLRRSLGKRDFARLMKEGIGFMRAMGWMTIRWGRSGPLSPTIANFIAELVEEVGASLAEWSNATDDDELEALIREELRHPMVRGEWMGDLGEVLREIWARLPGLDDIIPPPPPADRIEDTMRGWAAGMRAWRLRTFG